ncbi:DegT/DnrJ/EryC1/StrS family aminotransferase [Amycolatopsis sp.]|uniref:DegT/DnrJ/EryC1/StrS family aminotransferase n=1 Tax=Amycolatopsis sp. TaxID=37632 RepID=UPI002C63F4FC|nr:DegT/DnrJ/EryC1/StrS family aminotransferase [Amycolatopsis sp.]HVV11198.1 DegT/DnrJ/EryC1/StrS family aminotransferase [Amycolatopsis sp.]
MTAYRKIPLAVPVLAGNEAEYLNECVRSGFVSSVGAFVSRFEQKFAAAVGVGHAVACASGTAALHVALRLAGAAPSRLVAVSDFTFIASANAASYTGADLMLVDSEPETWNMNTALLHDEVVRRSAAGARIPDVIEVVHVLGHPADIEPLLDLRERFGIRIVEDAAESLGASWTGGPAAGRQVGTVGDFGCFSFNGNKIITSGGGGMIVSNDEPSAAKAKYLTTQAKESDGDYRHDEIGYNYRLTNIAAALGLAQLERLSKVLDIKRHNAAIYRQLLAGLPLKCAPVADWANPSYWLHSILLDLNCFGPSVVADRLREQGIEARKLWPPVHQQKPYSTVARLGAGVADSIYDRGLSLPSSVDLTADEIRRVAVNLIDSLR